MTLAACLAIGFASAQTDPKSPPPSPEKPADTKPQGDTISTNTQIRKESDLKTMDAVKTKDHTKTSKVQAITKDTVATDKRKGSGKKAKP